MTGGAGGLIALRARAFRNAVRLAPLRYLVGIGFLAALAWGIETATFRGVRFVDGFPAIDTIADAALQRSLEALVTLLLLAVAFSVLTSAVTTLYSSDDLPFLLALPVAATRVFGLKVAETYLSSALVPALLTLPLLVGLGLARDAPWVYYPVAMVAVLALFAVPVTLGALAALVLMRFAPAGRVKEAATALSVVLAAGLILGFFAIVQPAPLPWHLRRAWISLAALSLLMAPLGMTGIHAVSGQFNNAAQGVFCVFVLLNGPQQWSRTSPLGRVALAYLLTTSLLGLGMVTRTWFPHWASFSVVYFWPMMLMTQSAMLIAVLIIGGRHLAELPRQQQQLEQAQQARERLATLARDFASLLSVVSHEIRNPASALRLVAANLGRGAVSAAEAAQDLRRLSVHLADIVSAMQRQRVAFAPEDGATDFQYDPAEKLAQVRGALVERIDPERLHVVLEDGVGPGSHLCNGARLGLILTNLLDNAFKYGGTGQVRLHLVSTPERLLVEVWDAGAGLAPTEVDRLFEQFWRSPRHQHIPGWGLGLWACQSAVESLGGTIRYESRQPSGASFRVEIRRTTQQDRQDT